MELKQNALEGSGIKFWMNREVLASGGGSEVVECRKYLSSFAGSGRDRKEIAYIRILNSEHNSGCFQQVIYNFGEFRLRYPSVVAVEAKKHWQRLRIPLVRVFDDQAQKAL